jgi:heme-degrading monooxygenase HmoA
MRRPILLILAAAALSLAAAPPALPPAMMVARIWHGKVPEARTAEYWAYLNDTGISRFGTIPGNLGADVMTSTHDGITEFLVISYWTSLDDIKGYAGADIEKVHDLPRDKEFLIDMETKVRHFMVRRSERHAAVKPH